MIATVIDLTGCARELAAGLGLPAPAYLDTTATNPWAPLGFRATGQVHYRQATGEVISPYPVDLASLEDACAQLPDCRRIWFAPDRLAPTGASLDWGEELYQRWSGPGRGGGAPAHLGALTPDGTPLLGIAGAVAQHAGAAAGRELTATLRALDQATAVGSGGLLPIHSSGGGAEAGGSHLDQARIAGSGWAGVLGVALAGGRVHDRTQVLAATFLTRQVADLAEPAPASGLTTLTPQVGGDETVFIAVNDQALLGPAPQLIQGMSAAGWRSVIVASPGAVITTRDRADFGAAGVVICGERGWPKDWSEVGRRLAQTWC